MPSHIIIYLILFAPIFLAFLSGIISWHPVVAVVVGYAAAKIGPSQGTRTALTFGSIALMVGWWLDFYGHGFEELAQEFIGLFG